LQKNWLCAANSSLAWHTGLSGGAPDSDRCVRLVLGELACRRFDPGGSLDRRVNCRCVSQPRWVGARRSTKGGRNRQRGNPRHSYCPTPRSGALAVGGYKCSRGREREPYASAHSPARPTFTYESPGPSFYRHKERVQVYNGGVAVC
jgi:hypothetical protein